MEFAVALDSPFNLEHTLESGQVFRWRKGGEWWFGVVSGSLLKIRQDGDVLRCLSSSDRLDSIFVKSYFRLDDDLEHILATFTKDNFITGAIEKFYGLRLIRQDFWECLASFVLATNANIPRIQKMVSAVCRKYGSAFEYEGEDFSRFPSSEVLAAATVSDLEACGLGYRASFLKKVSVSVAEGKVDLGLASLPYEEARRALLKELFGKKLLLGVGPKVADCVLLYSCGKDEAFPIDVWIARVLLSSYPRLLEASMRSKLVREGKVKLSFADYARLSKSVRAYFGEFAGYAQQYLYMAARETGV
jgi:N-glycosylase/DNA lyase